MKQRSGCMGGPSSCTRLTVPYSKLAQLILFSQEPDHSLDELRLAFGPEFQLPPAFSLTSSMLFAKSCTHSLNQSRKRDLLKVPRYPVCFEELLIGQRSFNAELLRVRASQFCGITREDRRSVEQDSRLHVLFLERADDEGPRECNLWNRYYN